MMMMRFRQEQRIAEFFALAFTRGFFILASFTTLYLGIPKYRRHYEIRTLRHAFGRFGFRAFRVLFHQICAMQMCYKTDRMCVESTNRIAK